MCTMLVVHNVVMLVVHQVCTMLVVFFISNVRCSVRNANAYVITFSFSFKLLLGESTFFMENLQATASSRYPPEKLFRKISRKTPLKIEESLSFNDVADSIQSQTLCSLN